MLREAVKNGTPAGLAAKECMDKGDLPYVIGTFICNRSRERRSPAAFIQNAHGVGIFRKAMKDHFRPIDTAPIDTFNSCLKRLACVDDHGKIVRFCQRQLPFKNDEMSMMGIGDAMMKSVMKKKGVLTLPELMRSAREAGVKFIACDMAMDIMGISREELIEVDEVAGVATFASLAKNSNNTLFI